MVLATPEIIKCITRSKVIDFNKVIINDYRGFLIDFNIKQYFKTKYCKYNVNTRRSLNPNNRVHRKKFLNKLELWIKDMNLVKKTIAVCAERVTQHELIILDKEITYALNCARRQVEGFNKGGLVTKER